MSNKSKRIVAKLIVCTLLIPCLVSANQPNTAYASTGNPQLVSGVDSTANAGNVDLLPDAEDANNKLDLLSGSDDIYHESAGIWPYSVTDFDSDDYISFRFSTNLPSTTIIDSVRLHHEYKVGTTGTFTETGYLIQSSVDSQPALVPGTPPAVANQDISESTDLSSITRSEQLADLEIRFLAFTSENKRLTTWHDQVALTISYHEAEAPEAPSLNSPANATSTTAVRPVLTWNTAVDPDGNVLSYRAWLDNDIDFSSPILNGVAVDAPDVAYTLASDLAEGSYYWKVVAIDNDGLFGADSDVWQFAVDVTAPVAPSNLVIQDSPGDDGDALIFNWIASASETEENFSGYEYALSLTNDFTGIPFQAITDTDLIVGEDGGEGRGVLIPGLLKDTEYYGVVRAADAAGNLSSLSNVAMGTTIDNPPAKLVIKSKNLICVSDCTLRLEYEPGSIDTISIQAELLDESGKVLETRIDQPASGALTFTGLKLDSTYRIQLTAFDAAHQSGEALVETVKTLPLGVGGPAETPKLPQVTVVEPTSTQSVVESPLSEVFIPRAHAATVRKQEEPKAEPKPEKQGEIKGGSEKKDNDNENLVRNILLVILLVVIAGASYYVYQSSLTKPDSSDKKPGRKKGSKSQK